ncbi:unnamed protein product [Closterium sp. NIES-64]|nr:unnamed protein product [Closterium sp. NIES-64]
MDATTVCPIPAIDWRAVPQDEITHLAHQGMVAPDVSADHHIRNENEMRRRRRRHLRRMAREANAELARSVAEWRRQSFRHPESQAVVVLAAETARSRDWSAEDHRRSFSCGNLGEYGPPDASHGGCSGRFDPNGRENSSDRDGAPPRKSEQASCSPSGASGVPPGASAGVLAGGSAGAPRGAPARSSSSGASCKPGHRRGVSVNALPELCPYPPVDWRWVPSPEPAAASHCAAAAASHCSAAAATRCPAAATRYPAAPSSFCTAPPSGATSPAISPLSPSSLVSSPSQLLSRFFALSPDSNHAHRVQSSSPSTSSIATAAAAGAAARGEGAVQALTSVVHKIGEAGRGAGGQEAGEAKERVVAWSKGSVVAACLRCPS